jgi:hypothetical protein
LNRFKLQGFTHNSQVPHAHTARKLRLIPHPSEVRAVFRNQDRTTTSLSFCVSLQRFNIHRRLYTNLFCWTWFFTGLFPSEQSRGNLAARWPIIVNCHPPSTLLSPASLYSCVPHLPLVHVRNRGRLRCRKRVTRKYCSHLQSNCTQLVRPKWVDDFTQENFFREQSLCALISFTTVCSLPN